MKVNLLEGLKKGHPHLGAFLSTESIWKWLHARSNNFLFQFCSLIRWLCSHLSPEWLSWRPSLCPASALLPPPKDKSQVTAAEGNCSKFTLGQQLRVELAVSSASGIVPANLLWGRMCPQCCWPQSVPLRPDGFHQPPAGSCCATGKQAWKPGPEWGRGGGPQGLHSNLLLPALPPGCAGKEQHRDSPTAENLKQTNKKPHSISIFSLKIAVYKFSSGPRRSLVKVSGMSLKGRHEDHLLLALRSTHSTSVWSSGRNWANPLEIGKGVVMFLESQFQNPMAASLCWQPLPVPWHPERWWWLM